MTFSSVVNVVMSELAFQVAAGLNNTVAQVASVVRVLLSATAAVILDSDGRVSLQSLEQIQGIYYDSHRCQAQCTFITRVK